MAKSKLIEEMIQDDVQLSEQLLVDIKDAVKPKDKYFVPEPKKFDYYPGHARRDFRN